ncbi:unnamed protein product [Prunus brigantina]
MSFPKTRAQSSSSVPPAYITGAGVDKHAIEVQSKLHPFAQKNLDENNLSHSFPSSEVRNSPVKWADWIDRLLPRYGAHWKRVGIYDAILLSKQSINRGLESMMPSSRLEH